MLAVAIYVTAILIVIVLVLKTLGTYAVFIVAGLILVGGMIAGFVRHK
jgi:hypothetical protein